MSIAGTLLAFLACLAHALADIEHRGFIALALADDDPSRELDLIHRGAHGGRRRGVGLITRATTHEARGFDRCCLGHADHLEREQLFHSVLGCRDGAQVARQISATHQCRKCLLPVKTMAMW
jgi:hypothetical protein